MRAKTKVARAQAQEWSAALEDARALVFELGGYAPVVPFDVMAAGLVLEADETAYRLVGAWLRQWHAAGWSEPQWCQVLATDQRLLTRLPGGQLISLWWGSLVGLSVHLESRGMTLDYGDGQPRQLAGSATPILGVVGLASVYGVEALLTHPALEPVRVAGGSEHS